MNKIPPIKLIGPLQRQHAKRMIDNAPDGYLVRITEETRTLEQNAKMWPMLKDLEDQADIHGIRMINEEWKDYATATLLIEEGHNIKFVPRQDGQGFIIVGMRTSNLGKKRFANLIEIIYMVGANCGVGWSEKAQKVIDEYGVEQEVRKVAV